MNYPDVISIIPRVPPVTDGIGDYGIALASALRQYAGIETRFIVGDPAWDGPEQVEGFKVQRLTSRTERQLLALLDHAGENGSNTLLLHYEGYGYQMRGCPVWLIEAIERWKLARNERKLVTLFHELYASGPPWRSSFWLSPLQKRLAARLVRLSDQRLTSLDLYAERVRELSDGTKAETASLPVFSSIGEPAAAPPLGARSRKMVVFGTRGRRIEVYKKSAADLNRLCRELGVEQIIDVGKSLDLDISNLIELPVAAFGELPGPDVSKLLLDSVAGVIDYPARMLGKSTIFAAYCSHRVVPIVASHNQARAADGLQSGAEYWLTTERKEKLSLQSAQAVADNAHLWYQSHKLSVHALALARCLARYNDSEEWNHKKWNRIDAAI
jgi:hypothetical protein